MVGFLCRLGLLGAYCTAAAVAQLWSLEALGVWALLLFLPLALGGAGIGWWVIRV